MSHVTDPPAKVSASSGSSELSERVKSLRLSSIPEGENWGRKIVAWGLGICLLVAVGYGAMNVVRSYLPKDDVAKDETAAKEESSSAKDSQPAEVTTARPITSVPTRTPVSVSGTASAKGAIAYESKGYIIPAHQILVSPKVGGMIVSLNVEEGRRVTKGDILAELESTDYKSDLDRYQALVRLAREKLRELETGNRPEEISQAEEEWEEAKAQLVQADLQYKRDQELRKRSADLVTEKELEESESKFKVQQKKVERLNYAVKLMKLGPREERIAIARAELDQAIAEAAKAEWRFGNCTIRAPISGTILKKNAEEGNIVNPGAFNGSFSLCDLADLSDLEVDLNVQERDISRIFVGQKCSLSVDAYPERFYEGRVSRLMPIADRAKGAVPVRVKVTVPSEEEGVYLKPEMGAVVRFLKEEEAAAEKPTLSAPAEVDVPASEPGASAEEVEPAAALPERSKYAPGGTTRS